MQVTPTKDGDEVRLEGADGTFGGVATLSVGWGELVGDVFVHELGREGCRGLIVETAELETETTGGEVVANFGEGLGDGRSVAGFDGFGEDGVAVMDVDDEEVVVAPTGGDEEGAGLVMVGEASDGETLGEDGVAGQDGRVRARVDRRGGAGAWGDVVGLVEQT